ncbi:MAG: HAD family hydrolase [Micropruina sp.]|uniref:HAD family hydrolase n=1 Tax=Micropruina sp. TaxID=2737536 RepID=UPI0039E2B2D0
MTSCKVVLFDLDDTLTDRSESVLHYASRLLRDFSGRIGAVQVPEIVDVIASVDERGYAPREQVFSALLSRIAWSERPEITDLAEHWASFFPLDTAPREGAIPALELLRVNGFALGIVTNGPVTMQERKIACLGVANLMTAIVVSGAVGVHKPHPRIFEVARGHFDCASDRIWFVGDHPRNDILGAAAAGFTPVWLRGTHPWPEGVPPPRHQIDSLAEVLPTVCPQ